MIIFSNTLRHTNSLTAINDGGETFKHYFKLFPTELKLTKYTLNTKM